MLVYCDDIMCYFFKVKVYVIEGIGYWLYVEKLVVFNVVVERMFNKLF